MKLAARTTRVVPSATLNVSATAKAMASQGVDVVNFSAGEPAADTPEVVKAAAIGSHHGRIYQIHARLGHRRTQTGHR